MELILNWQLNSSNFINKDEKSKSSKNKLGYKCANLSQKTTLHIKRERIDLRWKKEVEKLISASGSIIRKDCRCRVYINNKLYILNAREPKQFSNNLANILISEKLLKRSI